MKTIRLMLTALFFQLACGNVLAGTPIQGNAVPGPTIAVLPLAADTSDRFFADGITDEIASNLARIPGINVAGRASVFWLKQQHRGDEEIRRALNATYYVEGSSRKAGDQVRFLLRLIRASDNTQLWIEDYNTPLANIFDVQQDVVKGISKALNLNSGQANRALIQNRMKDVSVYEDYFRARPLIRARGQRAFADAAALLERVVDRDPDFAPAAALLAFDYDLTPLYSQGIRSGLVPEARRVVESTVPKAELLAQRATKLDPKGADGFVALAYTAMVQGKLLAADNFFVRALALDPNQPDALHGYGQLLAAVGRIKESLAMRQRLEALEPVFPNYLADTAVIYWLDGRTDRAVSMLNEFRPGRTSELALINAARGHYREAAALLAEMPATNYLPGVLNAAERILQSAPVKDPLDRNLPRLGNLGFVFLHTAEPERVMEYYENNLEAGYFQPISTTWFWHPFYAPVRKTQRFKTFARNISLVEYWRARGWPTLCHPVGTADFACN